LESDPKDENLKFSASLTTTRLARSPFKKLRRVTTELGERMTNEELQELIFEEDGFQHLGLVGLLLLDGHPPR